MVRLRWKTKDNNKLIKKLERIYSRHPDSIFFFPLADAYLKADMGYKAEGILKKGLVSYPKYWAARVLLSEILMSKGNIQEAKKELEAVVEIVPDNLMAHNLLCKLYEKIGFNEASDKEAQILRMLGKGAVITESSLQEASPTSSEGVMQQIPVDLEIHHNAPFEREELLPDTEKTITKEEETGQEIVTATLAELYFSQGLLDKAVLIYKKLILQQPERKDWVVRLQEIEEIARTTIIDGLLKSTPSSQPSLKLERQAQIITELNKMLQHCQHIKNSRGL